MHIEVSESAPLSRRSLLVALGLAFTATVVGKASGRAATLHAEGTLPEPIGMLPNDVSAGVLANGVLYADGGSMLYALDASNGHQMWEESYAARLVVAEAFVDGTLLVRAFGPPGFEAPSSGTVVEAIDPWSRARRWSRHWGDIAYVLGTIEGVVFVQSGGLLPPSVAPSQEPSGGLSAVDVATGAILWRDPDVIFPVIAPDDVPGIFGTRIAARGNIELVSLDLVSGAVLWQVPLQSELDMFSPDAVDAERVYATTDRLFACDRSTGEMLWQASEPDGAFGVVAVPSLTMLAVASYDPAGHQSAITGFDATTGEQRWRVSIPGWLHNEPTLVRETLVVGNKDDPLFEGPNAAVFCVDPVNGTFHWQAPLGARWTGVQAATAEHIYVMARDYDLDYQRLLALDVGTGQANWELRIVGGGDATLLADHSLFLSGTVLDGSSQSALDDSRDAIIAIDALTGQVLWRIAKAQG